VRELFRLDREGGRKGIMTARISDRKEILKKEVKCLSLIRFDG
jgi:hypothetical protein